jgi:Matrixin
MRTIGERLGRRWNVRLESLTYGVCVGLVLCARPAAADVIVLANRATGPVKLSVKPVTGATINLTLAPEDVVPVFVDGKARLEFDSKGETKRYLLDADAAYYFGKANDGHIDLQKIGLGDDKQSAEGRNLPGSAATTPPLVIPVKILVDEEEAAKPLVWERRLRARVEAASAILDKYCHVQLKVVATGTWQTDNTITDFESGLDEFVREVKPFPGRLAIGFTSQYQNVQGRVHFAGTRGALNTHIFVREWARKMTEPERLELLTHELGHFLGASHSPEPQSVMRPVLGNRQGARADGQLRFDPVNTLVMSILAEDLRRRKVQRLQDLSPATKRRLRQIYDAMAPTMPEDPAAKQFREMIGSTGPAPRLNGTQEGLAEFLKMQSGK